MWIHVPKSLVSAYAPVGEELTWPSQTCSLAATDASLFVSGRLTQQRSLQRAWKKHSYLRLLSGMTLPRFLVNSSVTRYISSTPGIRANHFLRPESDSERLTPGISGPTFDGISRSSSQSGASLKTSEDISPLALNRSGETFVDLVTRLKQDYSVRRKSVRRTYGNGSTSLPTGIKWPTPSTLDSGTGSWKNGNGNAKQWGGNNSVKSLVIAIDQGMWPTPRASANENRTTKPTPSQESGKHGKYLAAEVQRRWATPTANCMDMDTMERNSYSRDALKAMRDAGTPYETQTTGMLDATWVEGLMGYPYNWTAISGQPDLDRFNMSGSQQESAETVPTEQPA